MYLVNEQDFFSTSTLRVYLYLPEVPVYREPPAGIQHPTDIRFGDQIRLIGYEVGEVGSPDLALPVTLYWQAMETLDDGDNYKYLLQLVEAPAREAGAPLSTTEREPYDGAVATGYWDQDVNIVEWTELPPPLPATLAGIPMRTGSRCNSTTATRSRSCRSPKAAVWRCCPMAPPSCCRWQRPRHSRPHPAANHRSPPTASRSHAIVFRIEQGFQGYMVALERSAMRQLTSRSEAPPTLWLLANAKCHDRRLPVIITAMNASLSDEIDRTTDDGQSRFRRFEPWGVALGLLLFACLGIWYSLAVPPFETPDELFHYGFGRHMAQGNSLPVQDEYATGPWHQEGSQAPLYYLLVGALTAGIDQSDFDQLSIRTPGANLGDPLYPGNKNYLLYSAANHPLVGANLALHVGRWLSLALGLATLWFIYATTRLAVSAAGRSDSQVRYLPLLALWVAAVIPQFAFISASYSNDSIVIAAGAVTVYWLVRLIVKPIDAPIRWWELVVLGILLGLAALTKLQGLGLAVVALLTGIWIVWQRRDWRLILRAIPLVVLPALLISGWWYWRNYRLYGDWFGLSNLLAINGRRAKSLGWNGFVGEFRGLRYSFWGLFGWFNILLPQWIYQLLDIITVVAGFGVLGFTIMAFRLDWLRRRFHLAAWGLLMVWALLSFGLWFYWTSQATGSQGRLLYPGLVAFVPLLVLGLWWWLRYLPRWLQAIAWGSLVGLLLGSSLYTLLVLMPASYNQPTPVKAVPDGRQTR